MAVGSYTGNILVGIKRSTGGNYLWSYHLWVTNYDPSITANLVVMPSGVSAMDQNMGATTNTSEATSYGLLYQWGRKDPFMGGASKTSNILMTLSTGSSTIAGSQDLGTLVMGVYNPNIYYTVNVFSGPDWIASGALSGGNGNNRWGGNTYNTSYTNIKNTKTIYDSCPTGWRVP